MSFRTRNQAVAAKVETTAGQDAGPTLAADAILLEDTQAAGNLENVDTNENTGALDDRGPIPAGGTRAFTGTGLLKGAGSAGAAPEQGVLLRGCGLAEYLLAAPIAGSLVAATTTALTLAAGDGTNAREGHLVTVGGVTRVVAGVAADVLTVYPPFPTAPAAGDGYEVKASALYRPASTSLETLTVKRWRKNGKAGEKAKLDVIRGAAGTVNLTVGVRQPARAAYQFNGLLQEPEDVDDPGLPVLDSVRPRPFLGATIALGGVMTKLNQLTFNLGNQVNQPDDPGDPMGYDVAGIVQRRCEGRINPPLALQSVRSVYQSWLTSGITSLWVMWGDQPGNIVSLYFPEILFTGSEEEDVNGYAHEGIPYRSVKADGGVFACFA